MILMLPSFAHGQSDNSQRLEIMRQQLAEEYYKTEIMRQQQERNKLEFQNEIQIQQVQMYRNSTEHSRNVYRYENNYNNINNINQSANTLYNVASQIKNISNLLK